MALDEPAAGRFVMAWQWWVALGLVWLALLPWALDTLRPLDGWQRLWRWFKARR